MPGGFASSNCDEVSQMNLDDGRASQAPLAALFEKHARSLKRMLGRRSPRAGWQRVSADKDLDDLVQEAFLCALSSKQRIPAVPVTRAYLFTIARNLGIDRWRRLRNRISVELDGGFRQAELVCPDDQAAEHEQREQAEALARYVEQLCSRLFRVYEARFVRGLSQRDAAIALGISRRQLRTLEQRLFAGAIRELKKG
jgi:RNA polymerase sigma-70 factor, ECF subfamily